MTTAPGAPQAPSGGGSVAKAIGLTTAATAIGYAITLLQQVLYARSLGVSADSDALGAALTWAVGTTGPVGTTLAMVFLPRYVRATKASGETAAIRSRATAIALVVGFLMLVVTLVGAPWLAGILVPGGDDARRETLVGLLRIAAPLEVTWPLIYVAISGANARERYLLAAGSFILPPLPVIGLLLIGAASVQLVALAYVGGTVLQLAALWVIEPESRPHLGAPSAGLAIRLRQDILPVGLAFGVLSLLPLEVRGLASGHGVGAIAISDYASRLVVAGQQVLLSGLLAVTFTRWSRRVEGEPGAGIDSVERTLLLVGAAGVVIAALLPLVSVSVIRVIFGGGSFHEGDAEAVGTFVVWMGPGIAGQMVLTVALRALLATDRHAPLLVACAAAVVVALVVGAAGQSIWGLNGVAAGYSAGYLVAAAIAVWAIRNERAPVPKLERESGPLQLALHEDIR